MKKLIFDDVEVGKKELYDGKKAVNLSNVNVDKIAIIKLKEIMK